MAAPSLPKRPQQERQDTSGSHRPTSLTVDLRFVSPPTGRSRYTTLLKGHLAYGDLAAAWRLLEEMEERLTGELPRVL